MKSQNNTYGRSPFNWWQKLIINIQNWWYEIR
jgi:hypothetical protein